jgi:hypothetical protein
MAQWDDITANGTDGRLRLTAGQNTAFLSTATCAGKLLNTCFRTRGGEVGGLRKGPRASMRGPS